MMWFKREPKPLLADKHDSVVSKLRRKKAVLLKPTRESSERETSTESEIERRRYSDILDMKVSLERRDESDESLYESADCQSDAISASDDALPPTISKESLKLAITDEEADLKVNKKGHRKTMSLSNPLEIVRCLGDEWLEAAKKELEKNSDKKKSRESLWSEEDRDSNDNTIKVEQTRKNSKKEEKRKSSSADEPKFRKPSKASSVGALIFLRRRKTPTLVPKMVEVVDEVVDNATKLDGMILAHTKFFLEHEKRHASLCEGKPSDETDSDEEEPVTPKSIIANGERRRLSRQTSRSKSKARGKSQSVKVNTLRKSHSGTLKKAKKKGIKTPVPGRSRQASFAEPSGVKKKSDVLKHNSWLFSVHRGDTKREGSSEEPAAVEGDGDVTDVKDQHDKENNKQKQSPRGVTRAESCRERDTPHSRRGKQRNASDPNRLTAPDHARDLEANAATAPSGSSSSSSLSSRSNESNTTADQQGSQSEMSEDEEPLCSVWTESISPEVLDSLNLSPRLRKRQEVIHELIVSEQSHVRWLKVLLHIFAKPLQKTRLLPTEDVRELFPNLPAVRERHLKLLQDLMALRSNLNPVPIGPLASAVSKTLSSPTYASCLSKFCGGQRRALDRLRERRRKNKELHQFLLAREQMPQCGRLQLRDLLACVWQRLTKYQLLLENIVRSVSAEDDPSEVELLRGALHTAKSVLNAVDSAVRQKENEHRLKSIQSKLEVRSSPVSGAELEELRKLELHKHQLTMEGELTLRCDTKKTTVTALMLSECLVLLQREGDKYILKHITTQSATTLSPIIKWRNVLFRPNAAVKNTFFLMNINGVQMHELSTNTAAEYATWSRHIQEAPLAEARGTRPVTQSLRTQDEQVSGGGASVSRNPSDASEKSQECPRDTPEPSTEPSPPMPTEDNNNTQPPNDDATHEDRDERKVGSISTHNDDPPPPLEDSTVLQVNDPAVLYEAITAVSPEEQLRRLDETISAAMAEKNRIVCTMLGIPADCYPEVAEIAVADTLGHVDVRGELGVSKPDVWEEDDMQQLLLAAQQQAAQLTERISRAISSDVNYVPSARNSRSLCDTCNNRIQKDACHQPLPDAMDTSNSKESFDMLTDCDMQQHESARALAARLLSPCSVVESSISRLLALNSDQHRIRTLRLHNRETSDLRAHTTLIDFQNMADDDLRPGEEDIHPDAGSNGG